MRRSILPALLLAGAAACGWRGLHHQAGAPRPAVVSSGPESGSTPVVSARRLPGVLAGLVADQRLGQRLGAALADPSMTGTAACIEVSVDGSPVFARDAHAPLLPASNLKLVTAYSVIGRMGADAHLTTSAVAARPPAGGVIAGALYLVGGGDPLLATADYRPSQTDWTESREPVTRLEDLADRIKAAGVTRVTGGIVGDDSRYDRVRAVPTWKASYLSSGEIGPVGALVVNGGFMLSGRRKVPASDPAQAAAATLARLLVSRGVQVGAAATSGTAPAGSAPVAAVDSLPLREVVGEMLRESDNLAAEMLTKELGRRFGGGGTWAAGIQVVHDNLSGANLPVTGLAELDGSGLDRADRASCHTLDALTTAPGPVAPLLAASLPRAGDCGTLVKRFVNQPAAGRIRAKTGSLAGVAALTGFVDPVPPVPPPPCPPRWDAPASAPAAAVPARPAPAPASATGAGPPGAAASRSGRALGGGGVTVSWLVNGVASDAAGQGIEDRIASVLASYPEQPVLEPFGPGA